MKTLNSQIKEGILETKDGEILNYRVYSDGGVKIEGENMRKDFANLALASKYITSNNIKIINLETKTKTAVYYNQAKQETYELAGINNMQHAYDLYEFVCRRNNWNPKMFTHDVIIKLK
ncbi:ssDNA-specific exonuclease RecJ [Chryseobacterium defluvii]|uniref:SsDNA-specific exonuclease RecJ n=1 Tax=Chryseobacterium defluvii TaxID=160396 RepID=A0A840KHL6_9FLAO|nr:hypothetical protein [Chryseobacterium defluvii]MBB4807437.1 ssDNA-specific exonuclease RecJ [Chryseobacterium defluvii]